MTKKELLLSQRLIEIMQLTEDGTEVMLEGSVNEVIKILKQYSAYTRCEFWVKRLIINEYNKRGLYL